MGERRQYRDVARDIQDIIRSEALAAGDRLPPERGLSDRLGVSRSLVREALILLEIEGVVEVRKGSGIYISDTPLGTGAQVRDDIGPFELLQARQLIESEVAGVVVKRFVNNAQPVEYGQSLFSIKPE